MQLTSFKSIFSAKIIYEVVLNANVSLRISGDESLRILNTSVAKNCKFQCCIDTELSLFSSSLNVDYYLSMRSVELFHV